MRTIKYRSLYATRHLCLLNDLFASKKINIPIAYNSYHFDNINIYIMKARGGGCLRVVSSFGHEFFPKNLPFSIVMSEIL
jgi:hypothetical protein